MLKEPAVLKEPIMLKEPALVEALTPASNSYYIPEFIGGLDRTSNALLVEVAHLCDPQGKTATLPRDKCFLGAYDLGDDLGCDCDPSHGPCIATCPLSRYSDYKPVTHSWKGTVVEEIRDCLGLPAPPHRLPLQPSPHYPVHGAGGLH